VTGVSRARWPLILGLWAAPVSIAVSETFLSVAALVQLARLLGRRVSIPWPRCLWLWLVWAVLEVLLWMSSPEPALGWSEIRHLLLLAGLYLALSGFETPQEALAAWKGVFVTATASSLFLIGQVFFRLWLYGGHIAAGGDVRFYLRSGGFVGHWMVWATVEIVVVAGLLGFWSAHGDTRRRLWPIMAIHAAAVALSLTRMAWLACSCLAGISLAWNRSRWVWSLPVVLLVLLVPYSLAPGAVRLRAGGLADPAHYSNAERLQMLGVGWSMVREHPWTGVGAGRVDTLYESYLAPGEPVPAYHGHLHNNVAQIAAEFGLPVAVAALVFVWFAFRDLLAVRRAAADPARAFLADAAVLALCGFLVGGLFEYTYGHALGLIMITFAVIPPLLMPPGREGEGR